MSKARGALLLLLILLPVGPGERSVGAEESTTESVLPAGSLPVPGSARVHGTTAGLRLRGGPGAGYPTLTIMPEGTVVNVLAGPQGGFYQVQAGSLNGWCAGSYLQTAVAGLHPAPGTSWQIQLSGTVDTSVNAAVYDIDLFDSPQSLIDDLHAQGRQVSCYFSAGSFENWRPDAGSFPKAVIGAPLSGWPGERWLDVRASAVRTLMAARLDLAVSKGCDGVDPDNVDGYTNHSGFPLSGADQVSYNQFLASAGHARGLSVGLKNDLGQIPALVSSFDWVIDEQCFQYNECDALTPFIAAGKAVFEIEYRSSSVCPQAIGRDFDTLVKHLSLDAYRVSCR